jgi:hypothetical protein
LTRDILAPRLTQCENNKFQDFFPATRATRELSDPAAGNHG